MSAWKTPKKQAMPIRRDKDMERFVIVMPVDTSAYLLPCDDGDTCKLETLQKLVGGPIEMADTCLAASWHGGCGQHPDGRERRGPAAGAALQ